jgi:septal ring factor EnvC (AmiA/AmiB activator)
MVGQIAEKDRQFTEQAAQLAEQTQKNADLSLEIQDLKKQIEEKDQQLANANKEVRYMLARLVHRDWQEHEHDQVVGNSVTQAEAEAFSEKVKRMEGLMALAKVSTQPSHGSFTN